jgi:hypothetical protein
VLEVRDLAPATLSYSSPLNLLQGQAMVALNPAVAGGTPTSYMVSPSLPAGLSLHPTTGVISGTPSMASAEAQYLITAANATGSAAFTLRLAVLSPTALALNYPVIPALMRATAMSAISPVIAGSQVGQSNLFSVSPALPSGLSLNSVSGVISGTPSAMSASARHTITLVQGMRSATATVDIEVRDQAPLSLTYPAVLTLTQGVDMMSVSPSSTGGAITQYAVSPSLPAGVNLNLASGVLSGRPSLLSGRVNYVITGSNASGSASATIAIEVVMGSGGPAPGGTTVLSRTYEQSGLFGYLQMRCASCHGVSQIPRFAVSSDVDASAIAAWAKVNPTAPEQSILVVGNTGLGSSFVGGANFHASDRPTPQDRATILPYVQEWIRLYNLETGTGVAHGTARVRTAYEYFYGFGRVTGANLQSASSTDGITASARQSYDSARLRLPRSGAPDGLSGTTFAAYVNMVGAACLKFVETERALPMGEGGGRKAFIHVDFTRAPTDPLNISKTVGAATVDVRREMVIKLFEVFLQRAPSTEELAEFTGPSGAIEALVSAGWSSIVRTDASKMARTAQYACAIVAGSAESLIHR